MSELYAHTGLFRLRQQLCRFPRAFFKRKHVFLERFVLRVISHVQQSETDLSDASVSRVEIAAFDNPVDKFFRKRFTRQVVLGKGI